MYVLQSCPVHLCLQPAAFPSLLLQIASRGLGRFALVVRGASVTHARRCVCCVSARCADGECLPLVCAVYPTAIGSEPHDATVSSRDHWQRVMQGHAAANLVPVVASNRVGTEAALSVSDSTITFYGTMQYCSCLAFGCVRYLRVLGF